MKSIIIFNYPDDKCFGLINGADHIFKNLGGVKIDELTLFDDDAHALSYLKAMIDRGVWDDVGVYRHSWTLVDDSNTFNLTYSTEKFIEKLLSVESILLDSCKHIETDLSVCGFLYLSNYSIRHINLVPADFMLRD
jgi:hypothetical protein